jgi:tripartite-type tricarboxylate transporter receptor subunit TctC
MQRCFVYHRLYRFSCAAILTFGASVAPAQGDYPMKPVKLVVGSSPGGGTDTTARLIQPKLTEFLGQQVLVENRLYDRCGARRTFRS